MLLNCPGRNMQLDWRAARANETEEKRKQKMRREFHEDERRCEFRPACSCTLARSYNVETRRYDTISPTLSSLFVTHRSCVLTSNQWNTRAWWLHLISRRNVEPTAKRTYTPSCSPGLVRCIRVHAACPRWCVFSINVSVYVRTRDKRKKKKKEKKKGRRGRKKRKAIEKTNCQRSRESPADRYMAQHRCTIETLRMRRCI